MYDTLPFCIFVNENYYYGYAKKLQSIFSWRMKTGVEKRNLGVSSYHISISPCKIRDGSEKWLALHFWGCAPWPCHILPKFSSEFLLPNDVSSPLPKR